MAAPLTKRQTDGHRDSIETAKLIKRVQNHVFNGDEMTTSQMRGAELLLNKTMANMKAIEHKVDADTLTSLAIYKGNAPKPADN
jgi:hypothetical protein